MRARADLLSRVTLEEEVAPFSVSSLEPTPPTAAPQVLPIKVKTAAQEKDFGSKDPLVDEGTLNLASAEVERIEDSGAGNTWIIGDNNRIYQFFINPEQQEFLEKSLELMKEGKTPMEPVSEPKPEAQAAGGDGDYIPVTEATQAALQKAIDEAIGSGEDTIVDLRPLGEGATIDLNSHLDTIKGFAHNIWIVGYRDNPIVIDGKNSQILSIDDGNTNGFLAFYGVEFTNGLAQGGDGEYGGGGGLGAGGALFINNGTVVVQDVTFSSNRALGGDATVGTSTCQQSNNQDLPKKAGDGGRRYPYGKKSELWRIARFGGEGGGFNKTGDSFELTPGTRGNKGTDSQGGGIAGGNGGHGQWGTGGGSGGGGGAGIRRSWPSSDNSGSDGGRGGNGGFGGGAGGGGGAGNGNDEGYNGLGGSSQHYGGNGAPGERNMNSGCTGDNGSNDGTYDGGQGGGGAGLGGAIFVREDQGSHLTVNNGNFSNNNAQGGSGDSNGESHGNAIFPWTGNEDTSNGKALDNGSQIDYDTDNSDLPTLSLSLVNVDGDDISTVYEGERAILKLTASKAFTEDTTVYFYLSDTDASAEPGSDPENIEENQGKDFAWGPKVFSQLTARNGTQNIFVSIPSRDDTNTESENDL